MIKQKFDCKYLFAILFLSRLFVTFTYIGASWSMTTTGDKVVSILLWFVLMLLSLLPTVVYIRKQGQQGILESTRALSPAFSKGLAVFYILIYFLLCFTTGVRFELFVSSVMLPDTSPLWFLALLIAAAMYGAYQGFRAQGRASLILCPIVTAVIVMILLALTGKFKPDNITPLFYDGLTPVMKTSLYSLGVTLEISAVTLLASEMQGKVVRNLFFWCGFVFLFTLLLILAAAGVLGDFGNTRMFPVYSVSVQADFGVFQRIDALQAGVWAVCVLIKLSFFMRLIGYCLQNAFGVKKPGVILIITGLILLFGVYGVSRQMTAVLKLFSMPLFLAVFLLSAVLIPILIPALLAGKNRKTKKGIRVTT